LGRHPFPAKASAIEYCLRVVLLGETISAQEALRLGLVNRVVAPAELESETHNLAERLRDGPAVSIAAAKHAVYASEHGALEAMLQYEVDAQIRCFESEDGREGVRAFLEKRPPKFTAVGIQFRVSSLEFRVMMPPDLETRNSKLETVYEA